MFFQWWWEFQQPSCQSVADSKAQQRSSTKTAVWEQGNAWHLQNAVFLSHSSFLLSYCYHQAFYWWLYFIILFVSMNFFFNCADLIANFIFMFCIVIQCASAKYVGKPFHDLLYDTCLFCDLLVLYNKFCSVLVRSGIPFRLVHSVLLFSIVYQCANSTELNMLDILNVVVLAFLPRFDCAACTRQRCSNCPLVFVCSASALMWRRMNCRTGAIFWAPLAFSSFWTLLR